MKLINFHNIKSLNQLRNNMEADLIEWSSNFWEGLDTEDLKKRLESYEGIEVGLSEIEINTDGTFEYKGQKVLIYIRDQYFFPNDPTREYKFHICNCETIDSYFRSQRIDRYVVSTRKTGEFLVNVNHRYTGELLEEKAIKKMNVCKNCLKAMRYNGYENHSKDTNIYNSFSLKEFFEKYNTNITTVPHYTEINAPPNTYSESFNDISEMVRTQSNWRCDNCGLEFKKNRKYLHTHHINGIKSDNNPNNLKSLCIKCHSDQPGHQHVKYGFDYYQFMEEYKDHFK